MITFEFDISFAVKTFNSPDISPILQQHEEYWNYTKEFYSWLELQHNF